MTQIDFLEKVSILIPSRNEEKNLRRCLQSIEQLSYPKTHLQVILANDSSTDNTMSILTNFSVGKTWVKVLDLTENTGESSLKGKSKALEAMAAQADGKFFLLSDADIELPTDWVQNMILPFKNDNALGVVVGVTGYKHTDLFSILLTLEWYFVLYFCKVLSHFNIPSTGLGNNMAISKEAYLAVGGYSGIGFSIIEDYLMYNEIIKKGFKAYHKFDSTVLAFTVKPENYFGQRKRWLTGTYQHTKGFFVMALLTALVFPLFLYLAIIDFKQGGILLLFNILFNMLILFKVNKHLKISNLILFIPIYTLFLPLSWFLQIMYSLFTKNVDWKQRTY